MNRLGREGNCSHSCHVHGAGAAGRSAATFVSDTGFGLRVVAAVAIAEIDLAALARLGAARLVETGKVKVLAGFET